MEAIFHAPKRRPRVHEAFEAPLPVPFGAGSGAERVEIYKAEIINQHVIVRDSEHIQALYGRGYFGKGVLSRSRPAHTLSERWEYVGDKCLPVVSVEKYQKHVRWAHSALLAQGLDEDVISQVLSELTRPIQPESREQGGVISEEAHDQGESLAPSSHQMEDAPAEEDHEDSGPPEAKRPRRQGDPRYDPLAELYPEEPGRLDPSVLAKMKCRRHDDWVVHCGCRVDDGEAVSGASIAQEYVLVEEPDDDDEESDQNDRKCRLVCRINPFSMMEYLQLSYEEAFFLLYALGCLSVYSDGKPLTILQAWETFRSTQPSFDTTYAAYHYFRSKGWVPKSGVKYGSDFVLYWKGPPFYHASYSVVVERVNESYQGAGLRPFSWRSLAALSRTTANVSKELMLCYVVVPSDVQPLTSPELLRSVEVQTLIVSRWVSSRERAEQEEF